jgi:methionyl-tRNA formyltransferase
LKRLVLFGQSGSFISNALVTRVLRACRRRGDFDVVAVCSTGRYNFRPLHTAAKSVVVRLFDNAHPVVLHPPMWRAFERTARRERVPFVSAPRVNDPHFVAWLRREVRPDFAMSLVCVHIFGRDLLDALGYAVNYHNGLLPQYRGLGATNWSIYRGEERTGFSFHRMTPGIDEGPVLLQDSVPVTPDASPLQLEWQKTALAVGATDRVLDAMARGEPGVEQAGTPGYFSGRDRRRIRRVGDDVTWDDLTSRRRAFDAVTLTIGGHEFWVTKVRKLDTPSTGPLTFRTADGIYGRVTRLSHLPPALHRLYRRMRDSTRAA